MKPNFLFLLYRANSHSSPAKIFYYHNNGYNQCLPKPLGTDNHQIIINYGDSNNQRANPK